MRKTDYILIGVQKGGTTSAIYHFNQHPDIFMADHELHYFSKNKRYFKNNYESFFQFDKKIVGEKTPCYCYVPKAIERIYDYNPNMKLILFLREPISRAFSQYNMVRYEKNKIDKDFFESLVGNADIQLKNIKANGYFPLQRGYYIDQIRHILKYFPRENLHITISEEMYANPLEEYNKVFNFLGCRSLEPSEFKFDPEIYKGTYRDTIKDYEFNFLHRVFLPYNEELYEFLGRRIECWEKKYRENVKKIKYNKI